MTVAQSRCTPAPAAAPQATIAAMTDIAARIADLLGELQSASGAEHKMDAANVDLKAFTESFYVKQTGSHIQSVLDTLKYLKHETNVWFEITTLLIPGLNDSTEELQALSNWVVNELGSEVPLHFSAFHPDYKMSVTNNVKLTH